MVFGVWTRQKYIIFLKFQTEFSLSTSFVGTLFGLRVYFQTKSMYETPQKVSKPNGVKHEISENFPVHSIFKIAPTSKWYTAATNSWTLKIYVNISIFTNKSSYEVSVPLQISSSITHLMLLSICANRNLSKALKKTFIKIIDIISINSFFLHCIWTIEFESVQQVFTKMQLLVFVVSRSIACLLVLPACLPVCSHSSVYSFDSHSKGVVKTSQQL